MDRRTDRQTDKPMDGRTDKASYRDAWTHLKCVMIIEVNDGMRNFRMNIVTQSIHILSTRQAGFKHDEFNCKYSNAN